MFFSPFTTRRCARPVCTPRSRLFPSRSTIAWAASAALPCVALSAQAQQLPSGQETAGKNLQEMVVTANRIAQPLSDLVADMSIIDAQTIERQGPGSVADVLARVPGIQITRNGGPGTTTSVFLRGADSRFTAVYVDGVRMDSQSTGGASWQSIPLALIDRIEVLRGPAAAMAEAQSQPATAAQASLDWDEPRLQSVLQRLDAALAPAPSAGAETLAASA